MKTTTSPILPHNPTTLAFVLAGKCYVTLEQVIDGQRATYHVAQKGEMGDVTDPKTGKTTRTVVRRFPLWFVSTQHGAIGGGKKLYLGVVDETTFRTTKKTAKNPYATAFNINLFGDLLGALRGGKSLAHQINVYHCGRCGRCTRALSVPSSLLTGLGPDCAEVMGIAMVTTAATALQKLASLGPAQAQAV